MAKHNGFDYIVFDGQRVTNNYNPDSGAHSHLVIDAAGYTFERICRDTDCPVLIEWENEQDAIAEQEAERRIEQRTEEFYENLYFPQEYETDYTFYGLSD